MNAMIPLAELKPHKLTVDDYLTLHLQGRLDGCGRIELLDGEIYEMSPQSRPHVIAKNELGWRIRSALASLELPLVSYIESTISVEPGSAPEPDIMICERVMGASFAKPDFFDSKQVKLTVEVSVSTLVTDLEYKRQLYARAGIAEYWVMDVSALCFHQFWEPRAEDYVQKRVVSVGETLTSMTIAGLSVKTDGLY